MGKQAGRAVKMLYSGEQNLVARCAVVNYIQCLVCFHSNGLQSWLVANI